MKAVEICKDVKSNVTPDEIKSLQELKNDDSIMILPADKGRATVVMNTADYKTKIQTLLSDKKTYEILKKDPTVTYKNKLINILRKWKREKSITDGLYHRLYPTSENVPKFYGLPKIHKTGTPLRPIVSGIGSITYKTSKHLAVILNSVKGKNGYSVKNSEDLVNKIKSLEVPPPFKLVSYDVSALFTSIPVDYALTVIRKKLDNDHEWKQHTELSLEQIMELLELCLNTTYFVYDGVMYRQVFGAPMGAPISPGVADLTMEDFEEEAMLSAPDHLRPKLWLRYVDDTITKLHAGFVDDFTAYLNSRNPHIQFTVEPEEDGKLPFLDTCVHLNEDGSLRTTVYRKKTHTDQYLNWESNHHLEHKRSVVRTLLRRADTLVSTPEEKKAEKEHVKRALAANGYKKWVLSLPKKNREKNTEPSTTQGSRKYPVALPYIKGLSEQLQRVFKSHGVNVYHKPFNTLRSQLVKPKDKPDKLKKCGVIYSVKCDVCNKEYIGETARTLGVRYKEHTDGRHDSAIQDHLNQSPGHKTSQDNVSVLAMEDNWMARKIREAIHIHKKQPALNRDKGTEIPPIMLQLLPRQLPLSRRGNPQK